MSLRLLIDESLLFLSFPNLLHEVAAKRLQVLSVIRQLHFIVVDAQ